MSAPRAFSLPIAVAEDPRSSQHLARFVLGLGLPSSQLQARVERLCERQQLNSRTVSQRSEPSSRTALMGEQPNPWEVLPPQDATSRHRAISVVTDGADYLSTLLRLRARGRRLMATLICLRLRSVIAISPSRSRWISRYGVMSFDRLPTVLSSCEESTVISRFVRRVSTTSPQLEVPNHAVAVNAWA